MIASRIVVMGVSGTGKSTIGSRLAARLDSVFLDADDFHSAANIERMSRGLPLHDSDRWPWLAAVRQAMRLEPQVVVACSALKRSYRDALRRAGDVVFVDLTLGRAETADRLARRLHHFVGPALLGSQLDALEPPGPDETDVAIVRAEGDPDALVSEVEAALGAIHPGTSTQPTVSVGGPSEVIPTSELRDHITRIVDSELSATGARRVLVVPPDHTRPQSRAGEITAAIFEHLSGRGRDPYVLPALGGHRPMSDGDIHRFFGGRVPPDRVLPHRWRGPLVDLGEIASAEVAAVSSARLRQSIPVTVSDRLLEGWDLVVSVGQVVPHEVIGMSNYTKNLVVGLGGEATLGSTHWLGAMCDMETIMGQTRTPVRDVVDAAFERLLAPKLDVLWILTVMENTGAEVLQRGLFAGSGRAGSAAFDAAAGLSAECNVTTVGDRLQKVVCWLDPAAFTSTWLANKAIYRTRMALAKDGELVVLAPGVSRFGEDLITDRLIRAHGYRGTEATVEAVSSDGELASNLSAAAHLIHGSSDGRFRVVYCTDPSAGGLTRQEVEAVGYGWRPLRDEMERLDLDPSGPPGSDGSRRDRSGEPYLYVDNPALGLWTA